MIAIDIGNTKTAIGLFDGRELTARWRVATDSSRTSDQHFQTLKEFLSEKSLTLKTAGPMMLASVVPVATEAWKGLRKHVDIHTMSANSPVSYKIGIPEPESLGPDRIAAMEAAVRRYGAPVIVVDAGTATTLSVIDPKGVFLGGAIAPGVGISLKVLFERAARISRITPNPPEQAIGRTTDEAVESGAHFGFAAMIDGLLSRTFKELGVSEAKVVASGGAMESLTPYIQTPIEFRRDLTLEGLQCVYENLEKASR